MFLVFEGVTGHQAIIVSSVSGLRGSPRPSNPYGFKWFWYFREPQAFNPLWFQVFLDFEGPPGHQTPMVSSVSGVRGCHMPLNNYSFKCFWTFRVPQVFKPLWFQVFLDFEGPSGLQALMVSSDSGLLGSLRPSSPYGSKCFLTSRVLHAIKPLWFRVFLVFDGATGHQAIIVWSVSGLSIVWRKLCALVQHGYKVLAVVAIRT